MERLFDAQVACQALCISIAFEGRCEQALDRIQFHNRDVVFESNLRTNHLRSVWRHRDRCFVLNLLHEIGHRVTSLGSAESCTPSARDKSLLSRSLLSLKI
eukprot:TRINITY_DN52209_c0_g1_i1.p1 TRINITY_DN52209_c0_g1~~TRINITY_DN52209_c0_g1_i1.p1  ORF type:complete len:101 (+),score=5.16 TRINITY_DN52209_c0_g1_i1:109-411(+)